MMISPELDIVARQTSSSGMGPEEWESLERHEVRTLDIKAMTIEEGGGWEVVIGMHFARRRIRGKSDKGNARRH